MGNKFVEIFINKVICGDVLEILKEIPDNSIDLTITSPPYNKKEKYGGWLVDKVIYDNFKDKMKEEEYQEWQIKILNEIFRVTKEGGALFYNHKLRYENGRMIHPISWISKTKWNIWQEIIWDRKIAGNIRGWHFWQVDERIYWLQKGKPKELKPAHAKLTSIWHIRPENGHKVHPAPFPIELPARIIWSVLEDRPAVVLDPFCGSGTTLVAAKLLGKNFIGIDISEEYVKYSRKRLEESDSEKKRVMSEIRLHYTTSSFRERKERGYWDKKVNRAEVKTQNTDNKKNKLDGGGSFNDYTPERFEKHKEENPDILVSGFVKRKLLFIISLPFQCIEKSIEDKLSKKFPKGREKGEYIRSVKFNYKDYMNCCQVEIKYISKDIDKYEDFISKGFLETLKEKEKK